MVRHEAAEALGAIGDASDQYELCKILEQYCSDPIPEVAETCQLALKRVSWAKAGILDTASRSIYDSIGEHLSF